jgi:hypothetical protein
VVRKGEGYKEEKARGQSQLGQRPGDDSVCDLFVLVTTKSRIRSLDSYM